MTTKIQTLLNKLYPQDAASVMGDIHALIEQYHPQIGTHYLSGSLFTEQDTILITYGDSLHRTGEAPLKTLHEFAAAQLKDTIDTIHILPFYPYSSDDGFSVMDFYAVNPALGNWGDIEVLEHDFDLMFDAVFNHASAESDWFARFLAAEPGYDKLFRTESPDTDLSSVMRPRATPLLTAFTREDGEEIHVWTTFSADQVDFDARHPQTLLKLLDVLLFYIARGATIIRLDAIAYLWKVVGTSSIHLEQTHDVIRVMRAVLDEVAPQVILITETNVPHAENISYFGDGTDEAQMVYNFTLPPLLFYSILTGNSEKFRAWVNTLETPSERTTFFNFTASHDGIGVRPVEGILNSDELAQMVTHVEKSGGRVSYKQNSDGSQSPYELNVTCVDALIDPDETQELQVKRFMLSQAIAMSLAGVPAIYIHSLLGSRNDLAALAAGQPNRSINRAKLEIDAINAALADENSFRAQVFTRYQHLLKTRRAQPAFHPNAAQYAPDINNPAIFALLRSAKSGEKLLCVYNLTAQPQTVHLDDYIKGSAEDVLTGKTVTAEINLSAYGMLWLKL